MKVRELWRSCQSRTSNELRDAWRLTSEAGGDTTGWPRNADRSSGLEGWIRRHIRKCFWLRWHDATGRENALRRLGVHPRLLKTVHTNRGACVHGADLDSECRSENADATTVWVSHAIGSCGDEKPLSSTAGCGKPHVRWCGRVTGPQSPSLDPIRTALVQIELLLSPAASEAGLSGRGAGSRPDRIPPSAATRLPHPWFLRPGERAGSA